MPLPAGSIHPTMQRAALPPFPNGSVNAGQYTLLFRIRHANSKELLKQHSLILMPQRFVQSTEARTSLYYTKGGIVAQTPTPSGVGITFFQIAGHTGYGGIVDEGIYTPIDEHAQGAIDRLQGVQTPESLFFTVQSVVANFSQGMPQRVSLIDGAAAMKDLQDTLLAYFFPQGHREVHEVHPFATHTQELELEFLHLTAPTSAEDPVGRVGWLIHPHRNLVELQQDASRPFLYTYSLQFAALAPLSEVVVDDFLVTMTEPKTGLQTTLEQITRTVTDLTNGINTIEDAFTQMAIDQVTGPVSTFLLESARLGDALGNFITSGAQKLQFPLYAQRTAASVLDAPKHSVTTLKEAAKQLGELLLDAADPRSLGTLFAGTALVSGSNDVLTVSLNGEDPVPLTLGTQSSGEAIAATIQHQIRACTPQHAANAAAYRECTATYADGQYTLASGTKLSDSGSVAVVVTADPILSPGDASAVLGLGLANGGQEQAGSAYPAQALALLRGMEEACTHLQGFPDYFADQLAAQDAALAAHLPRGVVRPQIRGDQRMQQTRITPGDTLQGIANRVGVAWETLALVNRLTYPYILEAPTTLATGRASSASTWTLEDTAQAWPVDAFRGMRVDIIGGVGAGQIRRILRNTATQLTLEHAWQVVPSDLSTYAIREASNPILAVGTATSATSQSLTEASLDLVAGSQRGLILVLTSGPVAGERRQVTGNDATTYTVSPPWDVVPPAGTGYVLLGPVPSTQRQKVVGDMLSVPQPSTPTILPIRSRLHDVSAITGQQLSLEDKLFGRDALLLNGSLQWDAGRNDLVTIAGLPNLRQSLVHYINLPIGELEYRPDLGSYVQEELGLAATLPLQIQLLHSVDRTVRQDARIARMSGAQLVTQGGQTVIVFGAVAIDGSTIDRVTIR